MDQDTIKQDDIDSLFGDDLSADSKQNAIKELISKATESCKKLPMLDIIWERFANLLPVNLRNFIGRGVDVSVSNKTVTSLRFSSYIDSIPLPALVGIFKLKEFNTYGLIIPDSNLTFTLIDLLLGGNVLKNPIKIEGRPYTSIEHAVFRSFADKVLEELSEAFSILTDIKFLFERIEADPRFTAIARPGDSAILVSLAIELEDKNGKLEILLPYNSLGPISDLLLKVVLDESRDNKSNSDWEGALKKQVTGIKLNIKADFHSKEHKLQDISNLRVGSTIIMKNDADENIDLFIEGKKLFSGKIGQINNKIAIKIEEVYPTKTK